MSVPVFLCHDCATKATDAYKVICLTPDQYQVYGCAHCGKVGYYRAYELQKKELKA